MGSGGMGGLSSMMSGEGDMDFMSILRMVMGFFGQLRRSRSMMTSSKPELPFATPGTSQDMPAPLPQPGEFE